MRHRIVAAVFIVGLLAIPAHAANKKAAPTPPSDPYALLDGTFGPISASTDGKTRVDPLAPEASDAVFVIAGQSLCVNVGETPYKPANPDKVLQINVYDGQFYQAADPLVGAGGAGGSWMSRFGDKLVSDGKFGRVILVPICIGSTAIADWMPSGTLGRRLKAAFSRVRQWGLPLTAILWEQGQTDVVKKTSTANWKARFAKVRGIAKAAGFGEAPWFVPIDTMNAGAVGPKIQAAQAAVVDNKVVFAGPNIDRDVPLDARRDDRTHPVDAGLVRMRDLWTQAIEAHF